MLQEFEEISQPVGHAKDDVKKCVNILFVVAGGRTGRTNALLNC
jgi:hypothetical protein